MKNHFNYQLVTLGLGLLVLIGCDTNSQSTKLSFQLTLGDHILECGTPFVLGEQTWTINQFQFYVHDLQVKTSEGNWHLLELLPSPHSLPHLALVGADCTSSASWQIPVKTNINIEQVDQIQFTLGVPFEQNHENPLTQPSPLNQSDMFWVWQTGHKFLRWEMSSPEYSWVYHLGSTGCSSPAPVRAPTSECKNPNRSQIILEDFDIKNPIKIDIGHFLENINLSDTLVCKSSPDNADCAELLKRTGINGKQRLFRSQ